LILVVHLAIHKTYLSQARVLVYMVVEVY